MQWKNTKYNVPSTTGATFSASSETLAQFDAEGNKVYRPIADLPGKEPAILKSSLIHLSPLSEAQVIRETGPSQHMAGSQVYSGFKMAAHRR